MSKEPLNPTTPVTDIPPEEEKNVFSLEDSGQKEEKQETPEPAPQEDFQALYKESLKTLEEGQILTGTVIDITPDHVTVDVGYKCEGQIPIREFQRKDKTLDVKIGDQVEVLLERKDHEEGLLILSREKASHLTIWRDISRSCKEGEVMEGEVVSKVKGGRHRWPSCFSSGFSDRFEAGSKSRRADRPTVSVQGNQVQSTAKQHRALSPRSS